MAGESLNDKQAAAYTANSAELPPGGVRIVGTVATTGGSSSSPVVQPVSVTSGFPIIQPVSVSSGFPVIQPVSISSGFPVIQPVSISSGFPVIQPVSITSGFPVTQAVSVADGADVAEGSQADAAWVSGTGTVISLLKKIASAGGSAVSIADGADVTEGSTADAAVVTDASGTVSGKLRGLVKIWADVWDSGNNWIKVTIAGSSATSLGAIATGSNQIGSLTTGSSLMGALSTGFNTIGSLTTGFSVIGALSTGYNLIGVVATGTNRIGALSTGTAQIGYLGTGTNVIGSLSTGTSQIGLVPGQVATSNPGASTHTFLKNPMFDKVGRNVVTVGHIRELVRSTHVHVKGSTANTTIIAAGGLGVYHDLASLTITTTFTSIGFLIIKDGTATSIFLNYPNASAAPSAPVVLFFQPPIPQATPNTNWTVTQSSATMAVNYSSTYIKNI